MVLHVESAPLTTPIMRRPVAKKKVLTNMNPYEKAMKASMKTNRRKHAGNN